MFVVEFIMNTSSVLACDQSCSNACFLIGQSRVGQTTCRAGPIAALELAGVTWAALETKMGTISARFACVALRTSLAEYLRRNIKQATRS